MEPLTRTAIIYLGVFLFAVIFLISPIPKIVNNTLWKASEKVMEGLALHVLSEEGNKEKLSVSIGFFAEASFAIILIITPVSIFGGMWLARLAYDLTFGSTTDIYGLPSSLRLFIALVFMYGFFYSLYRQYIWIDKIIQKKYYSAGSRDESKLI